MSAQHLGPMSPAALSTEPYWMAAALPTFPVLNSDIKVDVAIIGGGLTGITTAYLLSKEGVRVALIERGRLAAADTGHTTAHLTYVTDYRLNELVDRFGKQAACAFWKAGEYAIDEIEFVVEQTNADCEFERVDGFIHEPIPGPGENRKSPDPLTLLRDADLAKEFGFGCEYIERCPHGAQPGVRFLDQAKFHPRRYLNALVQEIVKNGGQIFEGTELESVDDGVIIANGKKIRNDYLVIATHNPLMGKKGLLSATLFQTKLSLYTSYVLGAKLPIGTVPAGLYWDTSDPYEYLRVDDHGKYLFAIFGGQDVKTGQEDSAEAVFATLTARFKYLFPTAEITHRWLGQVVETDDGLPFVGENANREFVATGFCGNGYTLGTISALMARDSFFKRNNPFRELFRVDRKPFHGGMWRYISENADFPTHFLTDRLKRTRGTVEDVEPGEGRIVLLEGVKVAASRNDAGVLTVCSPVCTHLKCLVRWNDADKTWDCPCHGSRFRPDGSVLGGPAEKSLERIDYSETRS